MAFELFICGFWKLGRVFSDCGFNLIQQFRKLRTRSIIRSNASPFSFAIELRKQLGKIKHETFAFTRRQRTDSSLDLFDGGHFENVNANQTLGKTEDRVQGRTKSEQRKAKNGFTTKETKVTKF